ncbi:MAG TPA: tetratricopeptide repeat-containing glycosyltransferase family protein [Acetobacteraceae bacterium]|nr:tetratricopeptide repeat-containing glycosyltransferase family protein [Acetobacteraceae bacterium]
MSGFFGRLRGEAEPRPGAPPEPGRLRDEADRLRDLRDWRAATEAYAAYLDLRPEDSEIWIQHGHCVKEAGDPLSAIESYRRAATGRPQDADLQLNLGHALKLAGDLPGARAAYARALELDPANEAARREAVALRGQAEAWAAPEADTGPMLTFASEGRIVFDLSDLMAWFDQQRAPSGIQRVQLEVVVPAIRPEGPAADAILAAFEPEAGAWRALPREVFDRLVALCRSGGDARDAGWREAVALAREALRAAPNLAFPRGAWLVNLGSSWWLPDYHRALRAAKARFGLRYAALVHDCGPLLVPEHCAPAMVGQFARWFASLGAHADLLIATSRSTAEDIERLRRDALPGLPAPPVALMPLDAAPAALPPAARAHPAMAQLSGRPYALFVGTIESRKGHLFVLNAWLSLIRRHGAARVPRLVLIGRLGFMAEGATALLRNAPALAERVLHLTDVSDAQLPAFYEGCLFALYNSQHEGWGLPVTEALAHGKAVLAPGHSGLLDAGLGLATHFRAGSEPELVAALEALIFDEAHRAAEEARVRAGLRLRPWSALGEELRAALDAARPAPAAPPAIVPGEVHPVAEIEAPMPTPAMALADLVREGEGWHPPTRWGCWTRPGRALMRLPLGDGIPPGTTLRLHLTLQAPPAGQAVLLRAGEGQPLRLEVGPGARVVAALEAAVPGPVLDLEIEAEAPAFAAGPDGPDALEVGVGVLSFMACRADDIEARLRYLEHGRFVWPEPA